VQKVEEENVSTKLFLGIRSPNRSRPLWLNTDYVLLLSGQTISSFGTQASQLAFPLLILALTNSPLQAGIISGLRLVPYLVLGLLAGAWVDRLDRKRLMIYGDLIRALVLGSIPFAYSIGRLTIIQLYIATLIEGSLYVFFNVAEISCLPHIVSKEQMPTALGQDQASEGAANLIGPSIGGLLFTLNQMFPFLADAISYFISVISLLFIQKSFQDEKRPVAQHKLFTEIREGLSWLWQQPLLSFVTFLNFGLAFSSAGVTLLVITLTRQLHASSAISGLILAAGGIGQLIGSFLSPIIQKRFSYKVILIVSVWSFLLCWSLYLFAFTPFLLGVITAVLLMNLPILIITNTTYRTLLVPDEIRGRINSITQLVPWTAVALGNLILGILLQWVGSTVTILFFSACFLITAVLTSINSHVRHALSWAELHRIYDIVNSAGKIYSQVRGKDISGKNSWVSFNRYLVKVPSLQSAPQEIYAFPSTLSLTRYMDNMKWEGVDRYLINLPDRHKDAQQTYAFSSTSDLSDLQTLKSVDRYITRFPRQSSWEKWTGVDRYLINLPDRYKDA
jgi:MFS family permease